MKMLNVGSNAVVFPDWINIDKWPSPGVDLVHDARTPFPFEDNSIDFIYSEHFIEHLTAEEGIFYFQECYRMLNPGGIVRTATFDIDELMEICSSDEKWHEHRKNLYSGRFKELYRISFFNLAVYENGIHKCMYNRHEMVRLLKIVKFDRFNFPLIKESYYPELQNRETRENSDCIVEAIK